MNLSQIGEFGFIERIASMGGPLRPSVIKGIGDDCAVMDVGGPEYLLVTTDLLVERVHFLMDRCTPEDLGVKSIAVNVSDIAACGGTPQAAFVSVAIPERVSVEWLDRLYSGMYETAALYGADILGGDTTRSMTDLVINVGVTGLAPKDGVLFRKGAQPGDLIVLTGPVGESAAGLDLLLSKAAEAREEFAPLIRAHLRPRAHVQEGRILSDSGACKAAIDLSDGLSSDLGHICAQSGVGALLCEKDIPLSPILKKAGRLTGKDPLEWALHGGEDYALLTAMRPERRADLEARFRGEALEFTVIGRFVKELGMRIEDRGGGVRSIEARGWDHFR